MTGKIGELAKYSVDDLEKLSLIQGVYERFPKRYCFRSIDSYMVELREECCSVADMDKNAKYCPECGKKYGGDENVCMDCLVHLKKISDRIDVSEIESNPSFVFKGSASYKSFEEILSAENLTKVNEFGFTIDDYKAILHDFKSQAFKNFDNLVKTNKIDFDDLTILEKVMLFAKSFVKVEYKSSGLLLGYFEDGTIYVDDRQTDSLQITTLIHELSHFILQELLSHILCKILDCEKNNVISALMDFVLSFSPFTKLVDEYSAHNVEGRFTVFGFQDYSSFIQIENSLNGEMSPEDIDVTKSIGNTFALSVKDILEALIDRQLREEIKKQFLNDVVDSPDYAALKMENCQILTDEGLLKAIWLILTDAFEVAASNIDKLSPK